MAAMPSAHLLPSAFSFLLMALASGHFTSTSANPRPVANVTIYTNEHIPKTVTLDDLPLAQNVSQYGITWKFAVPVHVGQFINGDWYVVGPATIAGIDPKPRFGSEVTTAPFDEREIHESHFKGQYARNGSTLNLPAVVPPNKITTRTGRSGFDSRIPMDAYDPGQFTPLPIALKPGDSLVSSISNEPVDRGYPIKAVAILTCVAAPQPADAFRPSFCQSATCKLYLARNLRRDLLLKLPRPASAAKVKPSEYAGYFQTPWIDTVGYGRAMPRKKFQFYGPSIAEIVGDCTLLLSLDCPPEEKEPLLITLVQTGIDLNGLLRGGGGWPAEGGGAAGRKWPILFAGLMLDDADMSALTKSHPSGRFHEDEQTAFCPLEFAGKTYEHSWTGARVVWTGHYAYYQGKWRTNKWTGTYDPVDLIPPSQWPVPWAEGSEGYRRNNTSAAWVAEALAARLMHAEKLWDHDAFFAYVDRWMTEDDAPFWEAIRASIEARAAMPGAVKADFDLARTQFARSRRGGTISGRAELAPIVKELWTSWRNHLPPRSDGKIPPPAEQTWRTAIPIESK